MSKRTKKPATGETPAAAPAAVAASPASAAKKKPSLADRVTALEVKCFGHAPHADAAAE